MINACVFVEVSDKEELPSKVLVLIRNIMEWVKVVYD